MTGGMFPAGFFPSMFFCLITGAGMGLLFAVVQCVRIALGGGKVMTFVFDITFCLTCAGVMFLCALALDSGRLRMFQLVFQGVGAWAAVVLFTPLLSRSAVVVGSVFFKLRRTVFKAFSRILPCFKVRKRKKPEKTGKKSKKSRKKT